MPVEKIKETEWRIIKKLVKGNKTTRELASSLRLSVPNIHKHLKNLEKKEMVKRKRKQGKTKPFNVYSIGEGFVYLVKAIPGEADEKFMKIDEALKVKLRIWSIPQREYHYFIEKFWWGIQEDIEKINSLAIFGSVAKGEARKESDIDILIISDRVKGLEKRYGVKLVKKDNKATTIMSQVYSRKDFKKSLKSGSKFAEKVVESMKIIYDKDDFLLSLKENDKRKTG